MIPTIEATTARLLDAVVGQTEFDLVAALAFPLPANIVFRMIGVPEQDYVQVKQWCGYRAALSFGRPAAQDQVEIAWGAQLSNDLGGSGLRGDFCAS
jgi:cytochrome P450